MKLTIESTNKIITLVREGHEMPARLWLGRTEAGVECDVFITRVGVKNGQAPEAYASFEKELQEHRPPRADDIWPLRIII